MYGHPVTNRDQTGFSQGAAERCQGRAPCKLYEEFGAVVRGQPPGLKLLVTERVERGGESLVPAKLFQLGAVGGIQSKNLLLWVTANRVGALRRGRLFTKEVVARGVEGRSLELGPRSASGR